MSKTRLSETQLAATIRVPARFFVDHEDRDCEPHCDPVKRSNRFVWLRSNDPGLDELLDDARHYSEPGQFGEWGRDSVGRSIVRSAAATVAAIEAAMRGATNVSVDSMR
jgi:hypothetical protein